jgi:hypothetical protein
MDNAAAVADDLPQSHTDIISHSTANNISDGSNALWLMKKARSRDTHVPFDKQIQAGTMANVLGALADSAKAQTENQLTDRMRAETAESDVKFAAAARNAFEKLSTMDRNRIQDMIDAELLEAKHKATIAALKQCGRQLQEFICIFRSEYDRARDHKIDHGAIKKIMSEIGISEQMFTICIAENMQ